jgi:hypothetical protein
MNKDFIYRALQDICRKIPVIIAGSGASCAAGMPGMPTLKEHLLESIPKDFSDLWKLISDDLQKNVDLETALNNNKPDDKLENEIIKIVGHYISKKDREIRHKYFNNKLIIPIEKLLKYYKDNILNIITPNYDCLVEYCCDKLKIPVSTGSYGYFRKYYHYDNLKEGLRYFSRSTKIKGNQKYRIQTPFQVRLYKLHGSVDWYDINGEIVSDSTLYESDKPDEKRLIITPGSNKYRNTHGNPFRDLIHAADDVIRSGNTFLMVGYGFNDKHLEEILQKRLKEDAKPGIIITKELSQNAIDILNISPNVWSVSQQNSGSRINHNGETFNLDNLEIWKIDEFVKEVLGG